MIAIAVIEMIIGEEAFLIFLLWCWLRVEFLLDSEGIGSS